MKQKTKLKGYKVVKSHYKKKIKIPSDWIFEPLQSKINVLSGFAFNSQNFDKENGMPLIRIRDLANINTQIHYNDDFSKEFLINTGDLLVGMDGEFSPHLWKGGDALLNQRVCKITTMSEKILHQRFIYYTIKKELHHYELINIGTTVIHLSKSDIENISILFPTILEQQKIASILSGVDALIESTQKTVEKTERLKKGLMQQLLTRGIGHKKFKRIKWLFGKEIKIPEEWEMSTIESISKKLVSGGTPSTTISEYWNGDIHWTRSSILLDPYLKSGERFITSEGLKNSSSVLIPKNNLLVSSRVSVGNISINVIDIAISQDVTGIIINKSYVQFEFLYWYLKQYIKKLVLISQGTTIKGFTRKELANLLIFLPSLSEQQKIASILSGVDAYIQKNQQYKERLEKLKKGLMQKLLTGQIRVKV